MPLTANSLPSWAYTCYSNLLYIHYTFFVNTPQHVYNKQRKAKKCENQPMQSAALCLLNMLNRFVAIRCEQLLFIMNCTFSISITLSSFIFFLSIVLSLLLLHFYAVYLNFCFIMFVICSTAKSIKVGLNLNIFFCVHLFIYNFFWNCFQLNCIGYNGCFGSNNPASFTSIPCITMKVFLFLDFICSSA